MKKREAESARALAKLAAVPGVSPGAVVGGGRLHGRFATATWGSVTLLLFEWEVEYEQEYADGTAHGEYWDWPVIIKQSWTGRAMGYFTTALPGADAGQAGHISFQAGKNYLYNAGRIAADPAVATFTGWNNTAATANQYIFSGSCYASRARLSAPKAGMFTQEVSLRGRGAPSVGSLLA